MRGKPAKVLGLTDMRRAISIAVSQRHARQAFGNLGMVQSALMTLVSKYSRKALDRIPTPLSIDKLVY